ncbi:HAD family hydrolase [Sphaerisporangium fuscum]|uniref:HAD family hydrolase n=1 Tax=Sphaerisporangium fuscum TaxID=2835868 RepID=UPI001BDCED84|nr:HAD family hydrolase [Sphaerisporangium fuscum]
MRRLALFDLDNTLVDRTAGLRRWAEEFCADHGIDAGHVDWIVEADGDGHVPKQALFTRLRERFGLREPAEELWARYRRRQPTLVPACQGALEGLAALRQAGWTIGVVTNGFADVQLTTITRSGVAGYVDAWAISGAEGARKPDRRLFEIAAERCGVSLASGGWMVGDDPAADIAGGRAAGLSTVWIDRGRSWPGRTPKPDRTVPGAAEAVAFLLTR